MTGLARAAVANLRAGRGQQIMCAATAASALPLSVEVYVNHYSGSFANKWMWAPVGLLPALGVAGLAGIGSRRAAQTVLPATAALTVAAGALGTVLHGRGIARKPGGFAEASYNLVTGPPLLAPGSLTMVGGIGLLAAILRRETVVAVALDFRRADHLPKRREDGIPPPPEQLPRQRRGTTPQSHGRYPDYDVLANAAHWDEVTREVVMARARQVPPMRFFDAAEQRTLRVFCDLVTAQDTEPRIPVLEMVDAKLARGDLDGFRYHDMPEDPQTWRLVAAGLDEAAGGSFADLEPDAASRLVERFAAGELRDGVWERLPCVRAWAVVMRGVLGAFYSHPWAWNEIGYGGPAYPRGYMRLGEGQREPHQAAEAGEEDPVRAVDQAGLG